MQFISYPSLKLCSHEKNQREERRKIRQRGKHFGALKTVESRVLSCWKRKLSESLTRASKNRFCAKSRYERVEECISHISDIACETYQCRKNDILVGNWHSCDIYKYSYYSDKYLISQLCRLADIGNVRLYERTWNCDFSHSADSLRKRSLSLDLPSPLEAWRILATSVFQLDYRPTK